MKKVVVSAVVALFLLTATAAWAMTKENAHVKSAIDAHEIWDGQAEGGNCTGEFENVRGKTQWACYGKMNTGPHAGEHWQINFEPFEEIVFKRLCSSGPCPGSPE